MAKCAPFLGTLIAIEIIEFGYHVAGVHSLMSLFFFVGWISLIFLSQPYYPFIANYFFLDFSLLNPPSCCSYCCLSHVLVTKDKGIRKFPSHQNVHNQEHGPYNLHNQQNHQFWWLGQIHKFNPSLLWTKQKLNSKNLRGSDRSDVSLVNIHWLCLAKQNDPSP